MSETAVKGLILTEDVRTDPDRARLAGRELFPVANKPILVHALDAMRRGGIDEVAVCVPRGRRTAVHEAIEEAAPPGMNVEFLASDGSRPAGAILAATDFLGDAPFLVQHGDGLLQDDIAGLAGSAGWSTLDALVLVHRPAGRRAVSGAAHGASGRSLAVAGAQLFGAGFVHSARARLERHRADTDFAALTDSLRRSGARVDVRMVRGWRRYGGESSDLLEMNRALLDELDGERYDGRDSHDTNTRIEGRVSIHPTATLESSVIRGPAVIGPGALVSHSFVGPYTSIGPEVWLEGSEVEYSILLKGAEILHIDGRLEASIVGQGARVVKDFSVPRSLRIQIGDRSKVQL
jgi:glucose-1-phosphate thymidylyltransferase